MACWWAVAFVGVSALGVGHVLVGYRPRFVFGGAWYWLLMVLVGLAVAFGFM